MRVFLDPGHGLGNRRPGVFDPGAVHPTRRVRECDIALEWALTVKHVLVQAGIPVDMSRRDSVTPTPVGSRARLAARKGATHFISFHCNASLSPFASGTEVFHRGDGEFAGKVLKAAQSAMKGKNRGLKSEAQSQHSRLAVLDFHSTGPAALLEIGFITNTRDLDQMLKRETRVEFAKLLLKELQ